MTMEPTVVLDIAPVPECAPPTEPVVEQKQEVLYRKSWLLAWALCGFIEGFAMVKCLLPYPKVLADQFVFRNAVVVKMFLGAVGSSMVVQAAMARWLPTHFERSRDHGSHSHGLARVMFGLSILGVGMAVAGSGPTMVPPGLGARVLSAWGLAVGGLAATLLGGLVDRVLTAKGKETLITRKPTGEAVRIEDLLGRLLGRKLSYAPIALAFGTMMLVCGIALELIFDFKKDAAKYGGPLAQPYPTNFFDAPAWPPIVAGLTVGLGQLPVRMVSSSGMGGSGAFVTVVSTASCDTLFPGRSLQASFNKGFSSWQLVYNFVCVLLGSLLASFSGGTLELSHTIQPISDGFLPARAIVGMFLCLFGARIAGGCTCGHGVSGTSELSLESWIGAMTIFGAAIATRCVMVFGLHIDY